MAFGLGCSTQLPADTSHETTGGEIKTEPINSDEPYNTESSGYPAPEQGDSDAYLAPNEVIEAEAYPPPVNTKNEGKRFIIAEPVKADATTITGTGYAGTNINIVNLSNAGEVLGSGRVDSNGQFSIVVSPLAIDTVVAIMVGDGVSEESFRDAAGVTDIPLIGLILAKTTVN